MLQYTCQPGQSATEAAEQAGIRLPLSCRNGVCELCRCRFDRGISFNRWDRQHVQADGQQVFLCNMLPESDCEFYIEDVLAPGELRLKNYNCRIVSVEAFNHDVYKVLIEVPAGSSPEFYAGQYLSLDIPQRDPAFFSIASAPKKGEREIELHIQAASDWSSATAIIDFLNSNNTVKVSLPYGRACLHEQTELPLVLIAAGTGFAQMKSIVEYVHQQKPEHPIALYWGVRKSEDLYGLSITDQWKKSNPNFSLHTVVGDVEDNEWPGHHEQLYQAVLKAEHDLQNDLVLASGSPAMVYSTMDALLEAGLKEENFLSDVLEYAPRGE